MEFEQQPREINDRGRRWSKQAKGKHVSENWTGKSKLLEYQMDRVAEGLWEFIWDACWSTCIELYT